MLHYKPKYAGHVSSLDDHCQIKKDHKKRPPSRTLWKVLLLCFLMISVSTGALLLFLLPRLHSNQFSKNISLNSAYFLSQYRDPSVSQTEKEKNPFSGIWSWEDNSLIFQTGSMADEFALSRTIDWDGFFQYISEYQISGNELFRLCYSEIGTTDLSTLRDLLGLPDEEFRFYLDDVPYLSQEGILPNGCEAVSATMLLQFFNISITPEEFVNCYLPMQPVYLEWGCRYGPDPNQFYAGDPFTENGGWGCFAPVITMALSQCITEEGYNQKAVNLTGLSLDQVFSEVVMQHETPVAIWVTIDMQEIRSMYQWQSYDHSTTYVYPANQHCMVLIGRDAEQYYLCDPYNSNGVVSYPIEQVEQSYLEMGKQCVALLPKEADVELSS